MKEIITERAELFDPNMAISLTFDIDYDMKFNTRYEGVGLAVSARANDDKSMSN